MENATTTATSSDAAPFLKASSRWWSCVACLLGPRLGCSTGQWDLWRAGGWRRRVLVFGLGVRGPGAGVDVRAAAPGFASAVLRMTERRLRMFQLRFIASRLPPPCCVEVVWCRLVSLGRLGRRPVWSAALGPAWMSERWLRIFSPPFRGFGVGHGSLGNLVVDPCGARSRGWRGSSCFSFSF